MTAMVIFSSSENFEPLHETLASSGLKIDLLITECPKPAGRGLKVCQNPAHHFAEKKSIKIFCPEKLDQEFALKLEELIKQNKIKLGLISAYGKIIPQNIIDLFPRGIINIHPSLLPKYRGCSPITAAILNGESETGYSFLLTNKSCDCGPILANGKIKISPDDTHTTLKTKIFKAAHAKLPEIINKYLKDEIRPTTQSNKNSSYTPKIKKSDGLISENGTAEIADRKIRAFNEWPRAFIKTDDKRIIIHKAKARNGFLSLEEVQVEGKNKINFSDFKRGYAYLLTKLPKFVKID